MRRCSPWRCPAQLQSAQCVILSWLTNPIIWSDMSLVAWSDMSLSSTGRGSAGARERGGRGGVVQNYNCSNNYNNLNPYIVVLRYSYAFVVVI